MVELELDDQDAVAGTVALEGGESSPFRGWLGLFSALEGSVGRVRDGGPSGVGDGMSPAEET